MLASKGLRIYEAGEEFIAMMSAVKSPLCRPVSSTDFQWANTMYLIVPTTVESLPTSTTPNSSNIEHLSQKSTSGSPADVMDKDASRDSDDNNIVFSPRKSLSLDHRAMSVEVLYAEEADPEYGWDNARVVQKDQDDPKNSSRGYVEWKACSSWVHRPINRRNSRGYVEWDTIWTTVSPWSTQEDNHVYDVVGESGSLPSSPETISTEQDQAAVGPATDDTPPALPERTYKSRLSNNNKQHISSVSSSQRHKSGHHSHSHHPDGSSCKKSHHHHHHHYHRHHKDHRSASASSTTTFASRADKFTPPAVAVQSTHTHSSRAFRSQELTSVSDVSQNYTPVQKLRGYKFSALMTISDPPTRADHSTENYWHLAPATSHASMTSWETGDVLDYIDGLHDPLTPKSRQNIYILLNNKQIRARFSESLEIESKLLSRGLISGAGVCKAARDKRDTVKVGASNEESSALGRRGTSRVTSTYV